MLEQDNTQNPVEQKKPDPVIRSLQIAREEGLPDEAASIIPAILMQESGGDASATGQATKYGRARGAMQIIPSTWEKYKHRPDADPYNLDDNLRAGVRYVKDLYKNSGGDLRKVLSGYYGAASDSNADYANEVMDTYNKTKDKATSYLQKLGQPQATPAAPTSASPIPTAAPAPTSVVDVANAVTEPKEPTAAEKAAQESVLKFTRQTSYDQDVNKLSIAQAPQGSKVAQGFDPTQKLIKAIPLGDMGLDTIVQDKDPLQAFTNSYFHNLGLDKNQTEEFMAATGWHLTDKDNLTNQLRAYATVRSGGQVNGQISIPTQVNVATAAMVEAYKSGGVEAAKLTKTKMDSMKSTFDQTLHELTPDERAKFAEDKTGTIAKLGAINAVADNMHFFDNLFKFATNSPSISHNGFGGAVVGMGKLINKYTNEIQQGIDKDKQALASIEKGFSTGEHTLYGGIPLAGMILRNAALYGPLNKGLATVGFKATQALLGSKLVGSIPKASSVAQALTNMGAPEAAAGIATNQTFILDTLIDNLHKDPAEIKNAVTNAAILSAIPWASKGLTKLAGSADASALHSMVGKLQPIASSSMTEYAISVGGASTYMYLDAKKNGASEEAARAAGILGFAPIVALHVGRNLAGKLTADPAGTNLKFNGDGAAMIDIRTLSPDFQLKVVAALQANIEHPVISNLIDIETRNWAAKQGMDADAIKAAFDQVRAINNKRVQQGGMATKLPENLQQQYQRILEFRAAKHAEVALNGVATLGFTAFDPSATSPIVQDRGKYAPLASVTGDIKRDIARLVPEVDTNGGNFSGVSIGVDEATTIANKLLASNVGEPTKAFAGELLNQVEKANQNGYGRVGLVDVERDAAANTGLHESFHGKQNQIFERTIRDANQKAVDFLNSDAMKQELTTKYGEAGGKYVHELLTRQVQQVGLTGTNNPEYVTDSGQKYQLNKTIYNPEVRDNILSTLVNSPEKAQAASAKLEQGLRDKGYFQNPDTAQLERVYEVVPHLFDRDFLSKNGISSKEAEALMIAELRALNLEDPQLIELADHLPKSQREAFTGYLADRTTKKYETIGTEKQPTKTGSSKVAGNPAPAGGGSNPQPVPSNNASGQQATAQPSGGPEAGNPSPEATKADEAVVRPDEAVSGEAQSTPEPEVKTKEQIKAEKKAAADEAKAENQNSKDAASALSVPAQVVDGKKNTSKEPSTPKESISTGVPVPGQALNKKQLDSKSKLEGEGQVAAEDKPRQGSAVTVAQKSKARANKAKGIEEDLPDSSASMSGPTGSKSEKFTEPTSEGLKERPPRNLDTNELKEARAKFVSGEYTPNQVVTLSTGVKVRMPSKLEDLTPFTKEARGKELIGQKAEPKQIQDNSDNPYGQTARQFMSSLATNKKMRAGFAARFGLDDSVPNKELSEKIKEAINISVNNPQMSATKIGKMVEEGARMSGDSTEVKRLGNLSSSDLMIWAKRRGMEDLMPSHIRNMGEEVARQKAGNTTSLFNRYGEQDENGFYSNAERQIKTKFKGQKIGLAELDNFIKKGGAIKADEAKWSGLDDYITGKTMLGQKSVDKSELLRYVNANRVKLKFSTSSDVPDKLIKDIEDTQSRIWDMEELMYTGENPELDKSYKEALDKLDKFIDERDAYRPIKYDQRYRLSGQDQSLAANYKEALITYDDPYQRRDQAGKSGHWSEKNILAHTRYDDRFDVDGNRVRHIDEFQSDQAQNIRKNGLRDNNKIKDLENKHEAIRDERRGIVNESNTILYRADNEERELTKEEKDRIEKLTERNKVLNNDYNNISEVLRNESGLSPDMPMTNNWHETAFRKMVQQAAADGMDKMTWTTGKTQINRYPGAEVLNPNFPDGMNHFYDNVLPKYAKKFAEKFGSQYGRTAVATGENASEPVHYIDISSEMKQSVLGEGVPMFNRIMNMDHAIKKTVSEINGNKEFSAKEKADAVAKWNQVRRAQAANDSKAYAEAVDAANNFTNTLYGSKKTKSETVIESSVAALRIAPLTNPLSRLKDVLGTAVNVTAHTGASGLKHQAAKFIDTVVAPKIAARLDAKAGKNRVTPHGINQYSEVFPEMQVAQWPKDLMVGWVKGVADGSEIARKGYSTFQTASGVHFQYPNRINIQGQPGLTKGLNRIGAIAGNAFDAPAARAVYEFTMNQLAAQSAAKLPKNLQLAHIEAFKNNPPDPAMEIARVAAEYYTYNNDNAMPHIMQNIINGIGRENSAAGLAAQAVIGNYFKYMKVPTNVWGQRVRLSPLALGTMLWDIAALHKGLMEGYNPNTGKYDISIEQRFKNMQNLTNSAAGVALTAAMATGTLYARNAITNWMNGNVGSSYDSQDRGPYNADLNKGLEPGTLKIPGVNRVLPVGALGSPQYAAEDWKDFANKAIRPKFNNQTGELQPGGGIGAGLKETGTNMFLDFPAVKATKQLIDTVSGKSDPAKTEANIGVVGAARFVGDIIDPYRRSVKRGDYIGANKVVVGMGKDQPERITGAGNPIEKPNLMNGFTTKYNTSSGIQELDRLGIVLPTHAVQPSKEDTKMTPDMLQAKAQQFGKKTISAVDTAVESSAYKKLETDKDKAKFLHYVITSSNEFNGSRTNYVMHNAEVKAFADKLVNAAQTHFKNLSPTQAKEAEKYIKNQVYRHSFKPKEVNEDAADYINKRENFKEFKSDKASIQGIVMDAMEKAHETRVPQYERKK